MKRFVCGLVLCGTQLAWSQSVSYQIDRQFADQIVDVAPDGTVATLGNDVLRVYDRHSNLVFSDSAYEATRFRREGAGYEIGYIARSSTTSKIYSTNTHVATDGPTGVKLLGYAGGTWIGVGDFEEYRDWFSTYGYINSSGGYTMLGNQSYGDSSYGEYWISYVQVLSGDAGAVLFMNSTYLGRHGSFNHSYTSQGFRPEGTVIDLAGGFYRSSYGGEYDPTWSYSPGLAGAAALNDGRFIGYGAHQPNDVYWAPDGSVESSFAAQQHGVLSVTNLGLELCLESGTYVRYLSHFGVSDRIDLILPENIYARRALDDGTLIADKAILIPVPEPATLLVLGMGALSLLRRQRRS